MEVLRSTSLRVLISMGIAYYGYESEYESAYYMEVATTKYFSYLLYHILLKYDH